MYTPTLYHLWVMVLLVSQLQAVPLRNHGGVIYGTDFLRILDPRARSSAAGSKSADQLLVTQSRTSTTTLTQQHSDEPLEENLMLTSQHLRKLESSSFSTISSVSSSFSSSSSSSSLSGFQEINTSRQKPKILNFPQDVSSSNDVKNSVISKTVTFASNDSITTSRNEPMQPAVTPARIVPDKPEVNNPFPSSPSPLALDAGSAALYDDYDYYYYYYNDDSQLPLQPLEEGLKDNSTKITEFATQISDKRPSPSVDNSDVKNKKISTTSPPPSQVTTLKSQKLSSTFSNPTATTVTTARPTTSRKSPLVKVTSTTTRPTAKHLSFRYQTTPRSTTVISPTTTKSSSPTTTEAKTNFNVTESLTENKSFQLELKNITTTTEGIRSRPTHSDSRKESSSFRNSFATTSLPSSGEDTSLPSVTSSSSSTTSRPPVHRVQDRHQRPKGQRNSTSRYFRYTTPSSKVEKIEEIIVTEEIIVNVNSLQKNLASASSSSVVVEVRVESPQPEARRMPSRQSSPVLQSLDRDLRKGTPLPPKAFHTVSPDNHATSFLLSDSLVVDLTSGPRTSNQQPGETPQRQRQSPSTRIQRRPNTSSERPKSRVALLLEQIIKEQSQTSPPHTKNDENTRVINDQTASVQIQTSGLEVAESGDSKQESITGINEMERQSNISNSQNQSPVQPVQTQSQSVSTSVSRTVAHTEQEVSSRNASKPVPQQNSTTPEPHISTPAISSNLTIISNETLASGNATNPRIKERASIPHGIAPLGRAPFGQAPGGLAPFGHSPEGLAPHGLQPTGIHPHGVAPHGAGINATTNTTKTSQSIGLTFVDARVTKGGAGANSSIGYVAVEQNISRFRLEEKTPDGFIIGEYGEVDHITGDVNGVRYTAEGSADPNLIYDALLKFLNL